MFNTRPIALHRGALRLDPMTEADVSELASLALANRNLLIYMNGPLSPDWYRTAIAQQREDECIPFSVRLGDKLVGTVRLGAFDRVLPALEIGWAWLARDQHGKGLSNTILYLLLRHAFDSMGVVRVQMKTAASNRYAQKAIERAGAVREGVLRQHRRLLEGRLDDSVMYSILDKEWPEVRTTLETLFSG